MIAVGPATNFANTVVRLAVPWPGSTFQISPNGPRGAVLLTAVLSRIDIPAHGSSVTRRSLTEEGETTLELRRTHLHARLQYWTNTGVLNAGLVHLDIHLLVKHEGAHLEAETPAAATARSDAPGASVAAFGIVAAFGTSGKALRALADNAVCLG